MADKLAEMLGPLTRALMDMPVGELEAASRAASRPQPTRPSGSATRSAARGRAARSRPRSRRPGPQMQAMQKALVASLPAIMAALDGVEQELERATANLPDPTYPKR